MQELKKGSARLINRAMGRKGKLWMDEYYDYVIRDVADLVEKVERRFYGKYRGFVVDNADPERLGRLKLKVPSVLGPDVTTGWAMPCVPYGGDADQGFLFIPEAGAGVWVEFEAGDLEFPIWVGTFWSKPGGESELPRPNDKDGKQGDAVQDPPTRKIIKTKGGHTIQFEDADDNEMVTIVEAKNGNTITMDKHGIQILDGANEHRFVMNSQGITIESDKDVTIAGQTITLDAKTKVEALGPDIDIKAQSGQLTAVGNPIHFNP